MKKIVVSLICIGLTNSAQAQPVARTAPAVTAAVVATSMARKSSKKERNVGLDVLAGKQIENCLILQAYWESHEIVCICLNKNKDEVYKVWFDKPRGEFTQGVFNELRKQFIKTKRGEE